MNAQHGKSVAQWMRLLPPALIAVLGVVLGSIGAPPGVIALLCGLLLAPYLYILLKAFLDARARRAGRRESMLEQWTLLGVGLLFCAAAVLTMQSEWRTGVVMLAFFLGCALISMGSIRRSLRERRFRALRVSVEGSRNIPAHAGHFLSIALGFTVVGSITFFVGTTVPPLIRGIGAFMALIGLFLLGCWMAGLLRQFLRFEPEGLVFGVRRWEYRVPWDNIVGLRTMEIEDIVFVFLDVSDPAAITVTPPQARSKVYKHLRRNGFCIAPMHFGMDLSPLLAALERYSGDALARAELAPRPRLR